MTVACYRNYEPSIKKERKKYYENEKISIYVAYFNYDIVISSMRKQQRK